MVKRKVDQILRTAVVNGVGRQVALGAAGAFGVRAAAVLVNFSVVVILGHALGAEGYGAYSLALAGAAFLAIPSVMGLPPLITRKVAEYQFQDDWAFVHGVLRRANQFVGLGSLVAVACAVIFGAIIHLPVGESSAIFWIALALVPIIGLMSVSQAAVQGLGRITLSLLPAALIGPLGFAVAVAVLSVFSSLTPARALILYVSSMGVAFCLLRVLLVRSLPRAAMGGVVARYETRLWLRSAIPLVFFSGIQVLGTRAVTLLLGFFQGSEDVGIYSVAAAAAGLISFLFVTIRYPVAPVIARLHAAGDHVEMQSVVTRTAKITFLITLPVAGIMLVFSGPVLSLFGGQFDHGMTALRILAIGELINVVTGPAGNVLVMTGNEGVMVRGAAVGTICSLMLSFALIPTWGANGAAIAAAGGVAVSNVLMVYLAWRTLAIYAPALKPPKLWLRSPF